MTPAPRAAPHASERIFGLDLLRAIAILEVVWYHGTYLQTSGSHGWYDAIARIGPNWVPIDGVTWFFVLSGFLIGRILLKVAVREEFGLREVAEFWWRRWFRTLPAYFLVLTMLVVLYSRVGTIDPPLRYFFFFQNFASWHPGFFPEAWSLAVEEWFYLLIPLLLIAAIRLPALDRRRAILVCLIAVVVAEALFRVWRVQTVGEMEPRVWDLTLRKQVVTRFDSLALGVIGAYFSLFAAEAWRRWARPAFAGALALIALHWFYNSDSFYSNYLELTLSPLAVLLMLPVLSALHASGPLARVVTHISLISYSMYLLHLSFIEWFALPRLMHRMNPVCAACAANPWTQYALYWGLTIALSWLLYRYWEKPTMALRDRWPLTFSRLPRATTPPVPEYVTVAEGRPVRTRETT